MHGCFSIIGGTCPGCPPKSTPMFAEYLNDYIDGKFLTSGKVFHNSGPMQLIYTCSCLTFKRACITSISKRQLCSIIMNMKSSLKINRYGSRK